jgi:hypothetical protein
MDDGKIECEEAPARREDQPALPIAVVKSGSTDALVATAEGSLHTDPHARIFGLSLAGVLAACLILNAASPSTRISQQPDSDFGTTDTDSISTSRRVGPAPESGLPVDAFGTSRSKACATNQGGEEPRY